MQVQHYKLAGLIVLSIIAITVAWLLPPIPQDPAYHEFVDQRTLYGLPNFWNVVSNLPFVIAGLGPIANDPGIYGFFLHGYWRAPVTWPGTAAALGAAVCRCVVDYLLAYHRERRSGRFASLRAGPVSADAAGADYSADVQVKARWCDLPVEDGCSYIVSKLAEYYDAKIYAVTGFLSGHSIKHIIAAGGTLFIYLALRNRQTDNSKSL
jgi:hypothetical protein